jgi:hypothetical protein
MIRAALTLAVLMASLLHAAPLPKKTKDLPRPEFLRELLGKDQFDHELQVFRDYFGEESTSTYNYAGEVFFHQWKKQGIKLRFFKQGMVSLVYLYSGRTEGYEPYRGELPEGLKFSFTMVEVEKLFGESENITGGRNLPGGGEHRVAWSYPKKGIVVQFDTTDLTDKKAPISHITLMKPRGYGDD